MDLFKFTYQFFNGMRYLFLVTAFIFSIKSYSQNADINLLKYVNAPHPVAADGFMKLMSNTDAAICIAIPASVGIYSLIKKDDVQFRNALELGVAAALNGVITIGLKETVKRERPFVTYPFINKKSDAGSYSFPSGHTSSAFAAATSLTLVYQKWYVAVPAYTWASTVAYSRMHLGVHYPSDVFWGAIIGAGCAYLTHKGNIWLQKKRTQSLP